MGTLMSEQQHAPQLLRVTTRYRLQDHGPAATGRDSMQVWTSALERSPWTQARALSADAEQGTRRLRRWSTLLRV